MLLCIKNLIYTYWEIYKYCITCCPGLCPISGLKDGRSYHAEATRARIKATESPAIDEFPMRNFIYGGFPVALLDHLW